MQKLRKCTDRKKVYDRPGTTNISFSIRFDLKMTVKFLKFLKPDHSQWASQQKLLEISPESILALSYLVNKNQTMLVLYGRSPPKQTIIADEPSLIFIHQIRWRQCQLRTKFQKVLCNAHWYWSGFKNFVKLIFHL